MERNERKALKKLKLQAESTGRDVETIKVKYKENDKKKLRRDARQTSNSGSTTRQKKQKMQQTPATQNVSLTSLKNSQGIEYREHT